VNKILKTGVLCVVAIAGLVGLGVGLKTISHRSSDPNRLREADMSGWSVGYTQPDALTNQQKYVARLIHQTPMGRSAMYEIECRDDGLDLYIEITKDNADCNSLAIDKSETGYAYGQNVFAILTQDHCNSVETGTIPVKSTMNGNSPNAQQVLSARDFRARVKTTDGDSDIARADFQSDALREFSNTCNTRISKAEYAAAKTLARSQAIEDHFRNCKPGVDPSDPSSCSAPVSAAQK